jgi:hypothetical protein
MGQQNDEWTSSQSYCLDCIQIPTVAWGMVWSEVADSLLHNEEYRILNVLGMVRSITKGLRRLHMTFGGFGLFNLPVKQLICQVNMLMQHYHTSTYLSRKLDASLRFLQLQLGTLHNPLLLDYAAWGHLAPLSCMADATSLQHTSPYGLSQHCHPRERGQVIMEIFFSADLSPNSIQKASDDAG